MKGARKLSDDEVAILANSFSGKYAVRNKTLFILGCCTGGRVGELLSLKVGDVWQFGRPVSAIYFERRNTKGKKEGRSIPLVEDAQEAITELIRWLIYNGFSIAKDAPLFPSQKGGRMKRRQALQVIEDAKNMARLTGKVTSHSCRKTFADRVLKKSGNLYTVKEALGHRDITTTAEYLSITEDELREAIPSFGLSEKSQIPSNCGDFFNQITEEEYQEFLEWKRFKEWRKAKQNKESKVIKIHSLSTQK
jgi:site-specific recombinase XerD